MPLQHGSTHPGLAGSELCRLLAQGSDAPPPGRRPAVAERLGHWIRWTDAIALASALGPTPAAPSTASRPDRAEATDALCAREAAALARLRATLEAAIDAGPQEPLGDPADFGPHRRHCLARQHAAELAVAARRAHLREALAQRSPQGARLAALDAAMERALDETAQGLLGLLPQRLQGRFEQGLRGPDAPADAQARFLHAMARLLRADLAHRLQPAQGLLDALRTL